MSSQRLHAIVFFFHILDVIYLGLHNELLKWIFMSRFFFFRRERGWEEQGALSPISENSHSIEKILCFMNFDGRQDLPVVTKVERPDTF